MTGPVQKTTETTKTGDTIVEQLAPSGIRVLDTKVEPNERAEYVRRMFDDIAPRYDLLNSLLSLNIHHGWRLFAARCAVLRPGDSALDVCSGTGDFAVELRRRVGASGKVSAIDFSQAMLDAGAAKFAANAIDARQGDATALPFDDDRFDAAVVGFGIRNVADPDAGVREMARVVKSGGRVVILEFSQPKNPVFKWAYELHSKWIMPRLGGWISGRSEAYTYLPESVKRWKNRDAMSEMLKAAGLIEVRGIDLTFGVVCVHVGEKP